MAQITFNDLPAAVYQLFEKLDKIEKLLANGNYVDKREIQDSLMPIEEAAKFLNLSKYTLYTKVQQGILPAIKPKGTKRLYFNRKSLQEYIQPENANPDLQKESTGILLKRKTYKK
ncbi:MAG TPA: helix-turn-helix domain-containing protein [Prolixibacteraceae bacterium]|nr:helix-turn-helix domain-containing protein [Prolixibacteraceae bacterium]